MKHRHIRGMVAKSAYATTELRGFLPEAVNINLSTQPTLRTAPLDQLRPARCEVAACRWQRHAGDRLFRRKQRMFLFAQHRPVEFNLFATEFGNGMIDALLATVRKKWERFEEEVG